MEYINIPASTTSLLHATVRNDMVQIKYSVTFLNYIAINKRAIYR
jgi:hypothetical protein